MSILMWSCYGLWIVVGYFVFANFSLVVSFCTAPNLIVFVGLIYLATGILFIYDSNIGLGIAYLGYAASNVGLFIAALAMAVS